MKLLFLYTELAGYFHACLKHLVKSYEVETKVFMWPVNEAAPFVFQSSSGIMIEEKINYNRTELLDACLDFKPDLVFVSGWVDNDYKYVAKAFRKDGLPVLCAMDNQWQGNLRQRILCMISAIYLKPYYSHFWVSGMYQYEYARRLGYERQNIFLGLYCADFAPFLEAYQEAKALKKAQYPRTFVYVGRLSKEKATMELYHTFKRLVKDLDVSWKLIFVGTGPESELMEEDEHIEMRGFVQPKDITEIIKECGCLILPSFYEPWGVVVHEFAIAGLPIIASDAVGATTAFVKQGYNGYVFNRQKKDSLKEVMTTMMNHSDEELFEMGECSHKISYQITPESWAATLMSIIK